MSVAAAYIEAIEDPRRKAEAQALDTVFRDVTQFEPQLWSGRLIGYGAYDYTYASGHSGTSLATGFGISNRQIALHIMPGYTDFPEIMGRLGKHKVGKACVYLTRLEHVDTNALRDLIRAGLENLATQWPLRPS
ncbi:MAG: DUF1801 domain-containing protein [Pseudomonadota bacterium]